MGVITFNGVTSSSFNLQVERRPDYEIPEKDYDSFHIPGKNGDLLIFNGSYKNVVRSYDVAIGSRNGLFTSMANDISSWLCSPSEYARLEDTYEPDYYKLATYKGPATIENILGNAGRATIEFDRKPQRFLKTGDTKVVVTSGQTLNNPTKFAALPIITVKGSGSGILKVGGYTVTISAIDVELIINSEIQDAYKGTLNKNQTITLSSEFPKLISGGNEISYSGGITSVEIIPKWWTI